MNPLINAPIPSEPSRSYFTECLDDFYELIQKVCQAVAAAFEYIFCCGCLEDDYAINYQLPPIHEPLPFYNGGYALPIKDPVVTPVFDISLTPNELPGAGRIEAEPVACPEAALPVHPIVQIGHKSVEAVLQEIRDAVRDGQCHEYSILSGRVCNLIRDHRDLLTQEHWIALLQEIEPSEGGVNANQLSDYIFNDLLDVIPEVIQKRRLARFAAHWVELMKLDTARVDRQHPFAEIFESFDRYRGPGDNPVDQIEFKPTELLSKFNQKEARGTTFATASNHEEKVHEFLALQELARFAPLLRAFANEKKSIRVNMPGYVEKSLDVNYLRDSVFKMAGKITGFFFYHVSGPLSLQRSNSKQHGQFYCGELNADKVTRILDLAWNTYNQAKANGDLQNFYEKLDTNGCFDWRSTSLWNYMQTFSSHPDFTLKPSQFKEKSSDIKIGELYRVFMNEQYAVYCERQEPKLRYEDFKKKIESRGSDARNDSEIVSFFGQYATMPRFEAWIKQKESQEILLQGFSNDFRWGGQMVPKLMASLGLDFEV